MILFFAICGLSLITINRAIFGLHFVIIKIIIFNNNYHSNIIVKKFNKYEIIILLLFK